MRVPIAREGWVFIVPLCGLAIVGMITIPPIGLFFLVLALFVCYFFRDPERAIPTTPGLLLSPADGKVVAITPRDDATQSATGTLVSIFLSVFDVHLNRAPISATVLDVQYKPGKFLPAFRSHASDMNEQNIVTFQANHPSDVRVIVKQIAGILARRIVCKVRAGDQVRAGERFGLIRFGSRVDVLIPDDFTLRVNLGDRVRGGQSVLAAHSNRPSYNEPKDEAQQSRTVA